MTIERMEKECPGADDPESRCPREPKDCVCWQVDLDYHPKAVRRAIKIGRDALRAMEPRP